MKKTKSTHKIAIIIFSVLIISLLLGIVYFIYPTIVKKLDKEKVIEIANTTVPISVDTFDFPSLKEINPDTIGWIKLDKSPLNYPVVQTTNNDEYLNHKFSGESSIEGTIFCDYLCSESSRNQVLYGHYMRDESMFGVLWRYQDYNYFKNHPIITYDRPGNPGEWEIFSVYTTEADYDYRQPDFSSDNEFLTYMNRLKDRSLYDTGVTLNPDDDIITLSTCIYTFDNARFAVHARKIK